MTILKDALNCREHKAGLEMSLSIWDKVCSEALQMGLGFHHYLLELTQGRRGRGGGEAEVISRLPLPGVCMEREALFICTGREPGGGWEKAAARGAQGITQPRLLPCCSCP